MNKLEQYQNYIENILKEYSQYKPSPLELKATGKSKISAQFKACCIPAPRG
jgi:hypothetical protein